jgi:uncharacterized RDD family membrane protein YckC
MIVGVIIVLISRSLFPLWYIAAVAYPVLCWGLLGQTVGMMPFRMRIVRDADGGKLTWKNVILRMIGWIISFAVLDIGFIWAAFDSRKRGWHDLIGGTVVIQQVG